MSYRNYLFVIDKRKLNKIKDLDCYALWQLLPKRDRDICEEYMRDNPPFHKEVIRAVGGEEAYEFGDNFFLANEISVVEKRLSPLFTDNKVHNAYNIEMDCQLLDHEVFDDLIDLVLKRVKNYYRRLYTPDSAQLKDDFDRPLKPQMERLLTHVAQRIRWLECVNDCPNRWSLSSAWLYEYEMFNLIHIKKMFDPKKHALIWIGS